MEKIEEILKSIRPEEDFRSSEDFIEAGLLDSFDIVTLVDELEQAYGITIRGEDVTPENFKNIKTIERLIQKH